MHKDERLKIATALGYYARATDPEATLAKAVEAYGLAEYRNDVDCQIAFRLGFIEAEKPPEIPEQLGKLTRVVSAMIAEIVAMRAEVETMRSEINRHIELRQMAPRYYEPPLYQDRYQVEMPDDPAKQPKMSRIKASIQALNSRGMYTPHRSVNMGMIDRASGLALDDIADALGVRPRSKGLSDDAFRTEIIGYVMSKGKWANAPLAIGSGGGGGSNPDASMTGSGGSGGNKLVAIDYDGEGIGVTKDVGI